MEGKDLDNSKTETKNSNQPVYFVVPKSSTVDARDWMELNVPSVKLPRKSTRDGPATAGDTSEATPATESTEVEYIDDDVEEEHKENENRSNPSEGNEERVEVNKSIFEKGEEKPGTEKSRKRKAAQQVEEESETVASRKKSPRTAAAAQSAGEKRSRMGRSGTARP